MPSRSISNNGDGKWFIQFIFIGKITLRLMQKLLFPSAENNSRKKGLKYYK